MSFINLLKIMKAVLVKVLGNIDTSNIENIELSREKGIL